MNPVWSEVSLLCETKQKKVDNQNILRRSILNYNSTENIPTLNNQINFLLHQMNLSMWPPPHVETAFKMTVRLEPSDHPDELLHFHEWLWSGTQPTTQRKSRARLCPKFLFIHPQLQLTSFIWGLDNTEAFLLVLINYRPLCLGYNKMKQGLDFISTHSISEIGTRTVPVALLCSACTLKYVLKMWTKDDQKIIKN